MIQKDSNAQDIIESIKSGNKNFDKRFTISKQKYLEKKRNKYDIIVFIEFCCVKNLNKYFSHLDSYIFTREDHLMYFLNSFHVEKNQNVFILEKANGIISSSVLMDSDETNKIILLDPFKPSDTRLNLKKLECIKYLGLQKEALERLSVVNSEQLEGVEKLDILLFASHF